LKSFKDKNIIISKISQHTNESYLLNINVNRRKKNK
jgi:hypothetical protein